MKNLKKILIVAALAFSADAAAIRPYIGLSGGIAQPNNPGFFSENFYPGVTYNLTVGMNFNENFGIAADYASQTFTLNTQKFLNSIGAPSNTTFGGGAASIDYYGALLRLQTLPAKGLGAFVFGGPASTLR